MTTEALSGAAPTNGASSSPGPWYLRPVPPSVTVAVLVACGAVLAVPALFVCAALAILVAAPGLGFIYLLFPESLFAPQPWHLAIGFLLGAAIWAFLFRTTTLVSQWFALSAPKTPPSVRRRNAA